VFLVAAEALAHMTSIEELHHGYLFPSFRTIRDVSAKLMAAVGQYMVECGLGTVPENFTGDWEASARAAMWEIPPEVVVSNDTGVRKVEGEMNAQVDAKAP
jgi:hypothetical protein